jgi:hypothetical protein
VTQTLVVVVDRNRKNPFGCCLTDHILVEKGFNFSGRWKVCTNRLSRLSLCFFTNDVIAQVNTLITHEYGRAGNQLADFVLALITK